MSSSQPSADRPIDTPAPHPRRRTRPDAAVRFSDADTDKVSTNLQGSSWWSQAIDANFPEGLPASKNNTPAPRPVAVAPQSTPAPKPLPPAPKPTPSVPKVVAMPAPIPVPAPAPPVLVSASRQETAVHVGPPIQLHPRTAQTRPVSVRHEESSSSSDLDDYEADHKPELPSSRRESLAQVPENPAGRVARDVFLSHVCEYIGSRYVKGGGRTEGGHGVDCSGLAIATLRSLGIVSSDYGGTASDLAHVSHMKPAHSVQKGDFVFLRNKHGHITHMEIAAGPVGEDGRIPIIHASSRRHRVLEGHQRITQNVSVGTFPGIV